MKNKKYNKALKKSSRHLQKSDSTPNLKAYIDAPLRLMEAMEYKDKPASITYNTLNLLSKRNAVISSIISTRINQISTFTKPARYNRDKIGYEIKLKDINKIPTENQKKTILELETFLENCGYNKNLLRDDFDHFVKKIVRDSLVYDQATFEIVPDRIGRPAEFVAVDASTIRAASEHYKNQININSDVSYVQVIDGEIKVWFTASELAFGVRNPRTDIYMQPYGFSEIEQIIHQITSHLFAEEYNSRFFSQGGTTKGILNFKHSQGGGVGQEQLESFKRQWHSQVSGMTGAWKTPVVQIPEGIEYINVSQSNREMEFEKWMNYLINIVCAVYQIDPAEVNFPNNGGVGGDHSSVFESSISNKLKNSKDKGLRPLLRFIETLINKYIISRFNDEYVFNFIGYDSKSEKEISDLETASVKVYKTVNEIRKEHDKEEIPFGDVILDPSYISLYLQMQQNNVKNESNKNSNKTNFIDNDSWEILSDDKSINKSLKMLKINLD